MQPDLHFADTLQKDTILRIDAKPNSGFNYAYYVFIPSGTLLNSQHFLLMETNNTGSKTPDELFKYTPPVIENFLEKVEH